MISSESDGVEIGMTLKYDVEMGKFKFILDAIKIPIAKPLDLE